METKVWMYAVYLVISIGLTVWVASTLSRNGLVFLEEVFEDNRLARAVNSLLVVGFYLLNLGYVSVAMKHDGGVHTVSQAMEELSKKIGLVLLVLGALHFFNVFALNRYRRGRQRQLAARPPLPPAGRLPMAAPVGAMAGQQAMGPTGYPGMAPGGGQSAPPTGNQPPTAPPGRSGPPSGP
ncbi:hypothetical protein I0C86_07905 [Plantactinospora sp. S1510]|uniref:Integral membrane protein n=1 Tax=Plantactinospora alkalitolerans TaxID=2789879 RepID=A0ABS0GSN5_9ACTN|nr:hypothetical protein [Plantactinospora alkalitolerans]MBF9128907.1 hypothetical protein [Plantactinospora alkalitolerans]